MTTNEKEQMKLHEELHKKIYDCKDCCPCLKGEKYCENCEKLIINFMNKYGAGVLTRDELIESLRRALGGKIHQLALLDEKMRKLKRECHQWKETCDIFIFL